MPAACSRRLVRFVWLRRAAAFRRCARAIRRPARSSSRAAALRPSTQDCTSAAAAVRTWHTVRSGFFPPPPLRDPRQEELRHRRQRVMPEQPDVRPPLVVVQAQFRLAVLKAALNGPAIMPSKMK
jgi:hypothetical protein